MLRLSENARHVLTARYLRRDEISGVIETPEELFERVAHAVAEAETLWSKPDKTQQVEEEFLQMMQHFDFLPNSPTLMNAGTELGQLSACFVLPVEDTMEAIFDSVKQMALIQRTGGGTGFSFSHLRPQGSFITSTGGEASGPVSFMKIFDAATEHIKQGGRRRGANMGVLRVDHPDILEFISAKQDLKTLTNFNLSVGMTDVFMQALEQDGEFQLIHPFSKKSVQSLKARPVFEQIVEAAWQTGDPGLIFLDTINRTNPTPALGKIETTNPCGEVPLLPYESCNLGSINLSRMVKVSRGHKKIDWDKLSDIALKAIRFLDNIIEINHYPLPEIKAMTQGNRKIGLGVMGFAEMLIQLGIPYASKKALKVAEQVMEHIQKTALKASLQLAEERGVFPHWQQSIYSKKKIKLRNATLTAIAPTGTLSIIAGTSSGIEPLFALVYRHRMAEGNQLTSINPIFKTYLEEEDYPAAELLNSVKESGSIQGVAGLPAKVKELFACALDIPVEQHLKIQGAFQNYCDNSVSKTINLPTDSTPEEIGQVYQQAWKMGLKGITIYRYGSKPSQVLEVGIGEEAIRREYGSKCDPEECRL